MRSSKHKERDYYPDETPKSGTGSSKRSKVEKASYRTPKILCFSQFGQRLTEDEIKSLLHKELRKFGEHNTTISRNSAGGKVAYVHFRYYEDAQTVKSAHKNKTLNIDPMICIDVADEGSLEKKLDGSKSSSPYIMSRTSDHYVPSPNSAQMKPVARSEKFYQDDAEDKAATRTLFIGNLDHEITEAELGEIFGRYGFIEDIDIKRGGQTHGSVYAFIRFHNLEIARRAKMEMSGQYIRKYQCRIGYGKHVPSNCLWVGSLGPWLAKEDLEKCFSSFNPLRIEWSYGRSHAYLVFSSLEVATSVLNSMQGFEICPGHFIRLDYSDESHIAALMNPTRDNSAKFPHGGDPATEGKQLKPTPSILTALSSSLRQTLAEAQNFQALMKQLQVVWKGEISVKNVNLPIKMCLIGGHQRMVDMLMKDSNITDLSKLKFTHALAFSHKKTNIFFDGILNNTFDIAVLVAMPELVNDDDTDTTKSFRMIQAYLRQKQVSLLSLLPPGSTLDKSLGTIHLFPQCNHIKQVVQILCPKVIDVLGKEYLFAVINTVVVAQ